MASGCVSKEIYKAVMNRRVGQKTTVTLCRLTKNGKPGKPTEYELFGAEATAEDVINRLERNNPGSHWMKAE